MKLQDIIRNKGIEAAVEEVSGVDSLTELGKGIIESYHDLKKKRKTWK